MGSATYYQHPLSNHHHPSRSRGAVAATEDAGTGSRAGALGKEATVSYLIQLFLMNTTNGKVWKSKVVIKSFLITANAANY